jgi:hypothetical protein
MGAPTTTPRNTNRKTRLPNQQTKCSRLVPEPQTQKRLSDGTTAAGTYSNWSRKLQIIRQTIKTNSVNKFNLNQGQAINSKSTYVIQTKMQNQRTNLALQITNREPQRPAHNRNHTNRPQFNNSPTLLVLKAQLSNCKKINGLTVTQNFKSTGLKRVSPKIKISR